MYEIRIAKCTDVKQIHKCNILSLPVVYTIPELIYSILTNTVYVAVHVETEKIVGYSISWVEDHINNTKKGHIAGFAIHPDHRRNGVGTKLLNKTTNYHSPLPTTLNVMITNKSAITFYRKNGFTKHTKLKNYYKRGVHALQLIKNRKE